ATAAPRTVQLLGVSTGHAGQPLVTARHRSFPRRGAIRSDLRRQPDPRLLGQDRRHRLNPGGDRQANRALHLIAVCRLRYCQRTRDYAARRTPEGRTQPEIIRCLKRYIAREIYNTLSTDLADLQPQPVRSTTILCGSPGFGITRKRT
ncbi:MAG: hypothetical protein JO168_14465, partial [Solirubrobacterales bacterium]|nr:hypothetical protein [Solirubrobacterales bacterium]